MSSKESGMFTTLKKKVLSKECHQQSLLENIFLVTERSNYNLAAILELVLAVNAFVII